MRYIKIGVIALFILTLGIYSFAWYRERATTDTTMPVISSDLEVLALTCDYTEEQLLTGLHAFDEKDGDLTSSILAGEISHFQSDGSCEVTYVVFDSSNHPATLTRKTLFTDYQPPQFSLLQPLVFARGSYTNLAQTYVQATDRLDGDISAFVKCTGNNIRYTSIGQYALQVEVTNSFGDFSQATLPVHVVDEDDLTLRIDLKQNVVYLHAGDRFSPDAWIASVQRGDGTALGTDIVSSESNVDTSTPGIYEVKYTAEDDRGDTGVTWLTVIVL